MDTEAIAMAVAAHKVASKQTGWRTIEEVRILRGWKPIQLKDVEKIVKLAVNVSTNGEVLILRY